MHVRCKWFCGDQLADRLIFKLWLLPHYTYICHRCYVAIVCRLIYLFKKALSIPTHMTSFHNRSFSLYIPFWWKIQYIYKLYFIDMHAIIKHCYGLMNVYAGCVCMRMCAWDTSSRERKKRSFSVTKNGFMPFIKKN